MADSTQTKTAPVWPRLTEPQKFGARFMSILLGASVFAWAVDLPNRLGLVQRFLAFWGAWLAVRSGGQASITADQIRVQSLTIDINYECTGAYVLLILFTFLLAYPASWKARVLGAGIGVTVLTAINIFRIAVLVRVAEMRPDLFNYFHEYVWQGVFLVLVVAYAMAWVERLQ
jgi:exosortase/archaeosortase family protein